MNRKDFLRLSGLMGSGMLLKLNGIPLHAAQNNGFLEEIAAKSYNDRVLILIELHGGNDGLNMVIPIDQYGNYYNLRPNIAIPQMGTRKYIQLDSNLADNKQVGLHPDMVGAKSMYDDGNMAVIQNVSYENSNGSHFRSRDIWQMGVSYDEYESSGWMGRYLEHYYPGYPINYPNPTVPDPLAIEIGTGVSLAFHRDQGIPAGLSIQNPDAFYNLINSVGVDAPINFPDSHAGDEIEYMMQIERQSNSYADRLRDVYNAGTNSSTVYPDLYPFIAPSADLHNPLAPQLKIISRLLSGGIKTKIFLCRIGGFDTHANQVVNNDSSMGKHAALMYHISSAVKAFYQDLGNLGLADRVLAMTYSEFGRRAASNASYGTDHGNAAPMLVFGTCLNPGVYGENPDLSNLQNGNIPLQHDYRQVFSSVVKDWFDASDAAINDVRFQDYINDRIDYIKCKPLSTSELFKENLWMNCFPNPSTSQTTVEYYLQKGGYVEISVVDLTGRTIAKLVDEKSNPGKHSKDFDLSKFQSGTYIFTLTTNKNTITKKVILQK
ncbi:hypothetical protein CW751_08950 [Brumimicrobium salinarum]|uniref:Secretion system C-terminal sorting domain-containing protein n=2 Tax=Brumimicrobium salinarum TaxID=2058658 RepID=A0A2I0R1N8_9FLAO|nr:hypothetical protein CW751_08950 [Brumimicrobium salinarum]